MCKILLVDDELNTANMLKFMLEELGYELLIAGNGQNGLALARQERPELIITDVVMPVMDGFAFYKALKEDPITKGIPVIVLTARGAMATAFEALGVDRFMEKPVERTDLMVAIVALLEHQKKRPDSLTPHQRVMIAGTYLDVVDEIAQFAQGLGHVVEKVITEADVLRRSVSFRENILIIEVQMEGGQFSSEVIRAIRLLPEFKDIPVLLYSYYRVSDLGSPDFRQRILNIEKAKDACMDAGATEYFDRYSNDLFREWVVKYI